MATTEVTVEETSASTTDADSDTVFGALVFTTTSTLQPALLGPALEDRGFESVWTSEHSHIPVSRRSPFGGRPGAPPLPAYYGELYDSYVTLATIAAATARLRLATGVALVAQRDPIWTAKQVATLDQVSHGRAIVGVGYGWNAEELANHGVSYEDRRAVVREKVLAMRVLWESEVAGFAGEHVAFEPSWSWPKPVRRPPVVLGSGPGPRSFTDVIEWCDGWMPNYGRYDLDGGISLLREMAYDAGRDPATIEIGVTSVPRDARVVAELIERGARRIVFSVQPAPPDDVLRDLDSCATLIERFT